MAGILDGLDPQTALLLGLSSGLLGTAGQGRRATFGEALGAGLQSGMGGYRAAVQDRRQAEQLARQQAMQDEQLAMTRDDRRVREAERQRADLMRQRLEQFMADQASGKFTLTPDQQVRSMGPTMAAADAALKLRPRVDKEAELRAALQAGALSYDKFLDLTAKQGPQFDKIDPSKFTPESVARFQATNDYAQLQPRDKLENWNGNAVNPYNVKPGPVDQFDPNKPFGLVGGKVSPNQAFQDFELRKAASGATRVNVPVSVNTAKNFWESAADVVGKSLGGSFDTAKSAQASAQTASRLLSALDSGKVLAGPGTAPARVLTQLGSALGIGGKDAQDVAVKTAQAMQEMAKLELEAATAMKGQGAITENERALLKRAAAGDLSMSVAELKALAGAAEKNSRARIVEHQKTVERVRRNPDSGPLADFMSVEVPPAYTGPSAAPADGWSVTKVK